MTTVPLASRLTKTMSMVILGIMASYVPLEAAPRQKVVERDEQRRSNKALEAIEKKVLKPSFSSAESKSNRLLSGTWFTAGSNLARIFVQERGSELLIEWLEGDVTDYFPRTPKFYSSQEMVMITKEYRDDSFSTYTISVLVPHPKFRSQREVGLIEEFNVREPPRFRVINEEQIRISDGSTGTLYEGEDQSCLLNFTLPDAGLTSIKVKTCSGASKKKVLDFANTLTVQRLMTKLRS